MSLFFGVVESQELRTLVSSLSETFRLGPHERRFGETSFSALKAKRGESKSKKRKKLEKPRKSRKVNLLSLLGLKKELGPFQFCPNPIHKRKKELAFELTSFPVRQKAINWIQIVYFHFWVSEASAEDIRRVSRSHEDLVSRVYSAVGWSLAGYPDFWDVAYEVCHCSCGATTQEGVRLSEPKPGETMLCPRCGEPGILYVDKRGYKYFHHFKEGTRMRCYIGKQ